MRLFIFNSNVIKILSLFLLIFIAYNAFLLLLKPNIIASQNQWNDNIIFAQDFIYEVNISKVGKNNIYDKIIVGSSMSARLWGDKLRKAHIYNLAFGGGSALSGLHIIKNANKLPKIIFVESNIAFLRRSDSKMLDLLFGADFMLKKYIVALQIKYQPINVFLSLLKRKVGRSVEEKLAKTRNEKLYKDSLQRALQSYNQSIKDYENTLAELRDLLLYFENNGVKIVFFEMPIDKKLAHTRQMQESREILRNSFAYPFLLLPDYAKYQTTDGIHLLEKSAFEFSDDFLAMIKQSL